MHPPRIGELIAKGSQEEDVVKGRKNISWKHLGINSCENCDFNIYEKEVINGNSYPNGQPNSPFLLSQAISKEIWQNVLVNQTIKKIWLNFLANQIIITVEYKPRKLNLRADWESKNVGTSSEWKLLPSVFQTIIKIMG